MKRYLALLCAVLVLSAYARTGFGAAAPSLEHMAGQMIMTGFRGTGEQPLSEDLQYLLPDIRAGRIGGVILFEPDYLSKQTRNIRSLKQVAALTALLQKDAPVPLFVGVDQEGGKVRRFKEEHGFAASPSAAELGRGSPGTTRTEAARMGAALHAVGVNLNFAPVLDMNVNPQSPAIGALGRSFSAHPDHVAAHGRAFAEGLASAGVIPCYKHFPGHGSARHDTHLGLADVTATWTPEELEPYRRILPHTPPAMIMPGHIVHREKGGELPASLSPRIITGLLRGSLGWQGVVITDDLQMRAVEDTYSMKEAVRLAVLAGADILLFGNNLRHDPQEGRKAHAALVELVREGSIPESRIRESYTRIMTLKAAAGLRP
ncbi:MAG: glycoside hydrolase family 3 [Desulfovibrionaceae bacterium]|nr:glycoside hydrolase family 3 [Desulfovibrionaceae bacterium]